MNAGEVGNNEELGTPDVLPIAIFETCLHFATEVGMCLPHG